MTNSPERDMEQKHLFNDDEELINLGATQEAYDLEGMAFADQANMTTLDAPEKAYGSAHAEPRKTSACGTPRGDNDDGAEGASPRTDLNETRHSVRLIGAYS